MKVYQLHLPPFQPASGFDILQPLPLKKEPIMPNANATSRITFSTDLDAYGRHFGDVMLRWSDNANPLGYHPVPMISIKGGEGPVVLITGATHGDEFEGPSAIMRLVHQLRPEDLHGQLIAIPALNTPALSASSRVNPQDGANLNRAFPGNPDGGPTAMLAHFLETAIMPLCDAAIDLHSGGKASFFAPCALATHTADEQLYAQNLDLARAFALPLIWELGPHNDDRSVNGAAERQGIPMIATELGGGGGVDPAITNATHTGLLGCLGHLGIISNAPTGEPNPRRVEIASPDHSIYAPANGLFDRAISAGADVRAGDIAGYFHYIGEPERPSIGVNFSHDGFVLAHTCRGLVRRGEMLALVASDINADQI
jgi:predicted deacylase